MVDQSGNLDHAANSRGRGNLSHSNYRHRHVGIKQNSRLGVRHYKLRLLDRHWTRRHVHFCDSVSLQPKVAHVSKSISGSDDVDRGHVRGVVSDHSHGKAVAFLLGPAISEYARHTLGELSIAIAMGLLCDFDLLHHLSSFLVPGTGSRSRYGSRPHQIEIEASVVSRNESRLERIEPHLVALRNRLQRVGGAGDATSAFGSQHREFRLCHLTNSRLALYDLPAVLCCRRGVLRVRHGDDADDSGAQANAPRGLHLAAASGEYV